jgi:cytochrome c peroxidase
MQSVGVLYDFIQSMKITNLVAAVVLVAFLLAFLYFRFGLRPVSKRYSRFVTVFAIVAVAIASGGLVSAQVTLSPGANPAPLKDITSAPGITVGDPTPKQPPLLTAVAQPSNLADFVQDETALLKLGKSLFWDMQLGSDGIQSCATCHFHAGADSRSKNQISPGLLASVKDKTFQVGGGANYQLTAADFPFHKLADPNNRTSTVLSSVNDVASSQGVFNSLLVATVPGQAADNVTSKPDPDGFQINGINVRRVEPRNTPTVINTIFNKLQFWDGRAKETFNGVNSKGAADLSAKVYKASNPNTLTQVQIALNNSSLASLVTEPLVSPFETSADGRDLPEIGSKFLSRAGKKLKTLRPLGKQIVHPQDGVLGGDSRSPQPGLNIPSYDNLIKQAFKNEWWNSNKIIQLNADKSRTILQQGAVGQTLAENQFELRDWNFSLFAGLAMQKYMSTLVSDQTPFDKFQAGNINALTDQEKSGLAVFVTGPTPRASAPLGSKQGLGGNCNSCHTIPEFTRASVRRTAGVASTDAGNPLINTGANGFIVNYGVRPALDDPGAGTTTPPGGSNFKSPNLRNIALTAPYMHNGGMATLEQVIDFYNRGRGDAGTPPAGPLELSDAKKADLVAFMRTGLTDQRVLLEQAPFDHPQLFIPNGHPGNQFSVTASGNTNGTPTATDQLVEIPAVGQNGLAVPRPNFLE